MSPSQPSFLTASNLIDQGSNPLSAPCIDGIPISSIPPSPTRALTTKKDVPSSKPSRPNLWKVVKEAVGSDLSRLTLPVYFNEPLSFLQRVVEDVQYSDLLDRAASAGKGSPDRAALVAAFVISHYGATVGRTAKPFNPLLGETFDFVVPERRLAVLAEQVCHHPPVSALHATGPGWSYSTAYEVKSKFHPNSIEVWPEGTVTIRFFDGACFRYDQAKTYVNNLVMGSLWIDNAGVIEIHDVGERCFETSIKLKRCSSVFADGKGYGSVTGQVRNLDDGSLLRVVAGNWRKEVRIGGDVVWTAEPKVSKDATGGHVLTKFAWDLNSKPADPTAAALPPTDSRLRPDERALEEGRYELAAQEKERLEKAQRERRRAFEEEEKVDGEPQLDGMAPKWFELVGDDAGDANRGWQYRGGYFEAKCQAANGVAWPQAGPFIF